mmetsp:Transcript_16105/g.42467  ORF Transcript_16105/g.42467 Transcript_16105/m.42467 type:complete len:497 (-) Transcript_16105:149-1639(-)
MAERHWITGSGWRPGPAPAKNAPRAVRMAKRETTEQSSSWLNESNNPPPGAADSGNVARAASATDGRRKGVEVREKISGRWGNWDLFDSQSSAANNYQNRDPPLTGIYISNMLNNRHVPQGVRDKYEVRRPDGAPQAQVGAAPQKKAAPAKKRPPPSSSSSEDEVEDSSDSDEPAAAPIDTNQTQFNEKFRCGTCKELTKSRKCGPCSNLRCATNTGGGTGTCAAPQPAEARKRPASPAPAPAPAHRRRTSAPTSRRTPSDNAPDLDVSPDGLIERTRNWFRVEEADPNSSTARDKGRRFELFMSWFMMYIWGGFSEVKCTGGSHDGGKDIVCTPSDRNKEHDLVIVNCKNYQQPLGPDLVHTMYGKLIASTHPGAKRYTKAVAAVHPRFTKSRPSAERLITAFNQTSLNGQTLAQLEWEGEGIVGIAATLKDKLTTGSRVEQDHFKQRLLDRLNDDFELNSDGQPKDFILKDYNRGVHRAVEGKKAKGDDWRRMR